MLVACGACLEHDIAMGSGVTLRGETGDPECVDSEECIIAFNEDDGAGRTRRLRHPGPQGGRKLES